MAGRSSPNNLPKQKNPRTGSERNSQKVDLFLGVYDKCSVWCIRLGLVEDNSLVCLFTLMYIFFTYFPTCVSSTRSVAIQILKKPKQRKKGINWKLHVFTFFMCLTENHIPWWLF